MVVYIQDSNMESYASNIAMQERTERIRNTGRARQAMFLITHAPLLKVKDIGTFCCDWFVMEIIKKY
jgi:hypothetical protein